MKIEKLRRRVLQYVHRAISYELPFISYREAIVYGEYTGRVWLYLSKLNATSERTKLIGIISVDDYPRLQYIFTCAMAKYLAPDGMIAEEAQREVETLLLRGSFDPPLTDD